MDAAPTKAIFWTVAGLGLCTWLWSLGLGSESFPVTWGLLAAAWGLMMVFLVLRWPVHGAILAAGAPALLPSVGPWGEAGQWAAAGLMGLLALRWWTDALRGRRQWNPVFDLPILFTCLWLGWMLAAACGSPSPSESLPVAVRSAMLVAGGLACGHFLGATPQGRRSSVIVTGGALLLASLWTAARWSTLFKAASMPFWQDANLLSAGLAFMVPLVIWLALGNSEESRPTKVFGIVAAATMLAGILWFNSRGAWLSLAVAAVIAPLLIVKSRKWRLILTVAALSVILFVGFLTRGKTVDTQHQKPLARLGSITNTTDFSNRERVQRWTCAWRMALEKPVLGHGPGRYAPLFKNYLKDRAEANQIAWWFGWRFGAHSDALTVLAEAGFPALLLFAAALFSWAWISCRRHWRAPERPFRTALILALATWLVHGQVNDLLSSPAVQAWVFMAMGILAVLPDAPAAEEQN